MFSQLGVSSKFHWIQNDNQLREDDDALLHIRPKPVARLLQHSSHILEYIAHQAPTAL